LRFLNGEGDHISGGEIGSQPWLWSWSSIEGKNGVLLADMSCRDHCSKSIVGVENDICAVIKKKLCVYRKNYMHKKFVNTAHENQKKYISGCARKDWIGQVNPALGVEFQAEIKPFRLKRHVRQDLIDRVMEWRKNIISF
jgi:hypothetical protein